MLTIQTLQKTNLSRAHNWHNEGIEEWSALEWAGAMCGEAGEAANIAKKMKRIEGQLIGNEASDHKVEGYEDLKQKLANEIGGTILYAALLASRHNIDLEEAVRHEFNRKSIELGFPQRL